MVGPEIKTSAELGGAPVPSITIPPLNTMLFM
jgi:hypothetical protein